ncbi:hypothetical protein MUN78_10145 [Leucobacter allii]|uniref:Minor tail protein n=1 Tax=Leucobacter allii TaxID=2932247 RepID=A0ABY4FHA7_9MICO|nr:hypothetical protein [Leucobacter allii]UOQ56064.1 hypothetical protein MUN78_10145 [Leucobacter allii]
MKSLRRKLAEREQAKAAQEAAAKTAQLARTVQLSRSSVETGTGTALVEDVLGDAPRVADAVEDATVGLDALDPAYGLVDDAQDADDAQYATNMAVVEAVDRAQTEAAEAAEAAANAQTTADGKNARRRGVTEPEPPPGGWVQGDQWVRDNAEGVPVELLVWNGASFVPDQILADEILVIDEAGVVRIGEGKVTAEALHAEALNFKSATGMELTAATIVGGSVIQTGSSLTGTRTYPVNEQSYAQRWVRTAMGGAHTGYGGLFAGEVPSGAMSTHAVGMTPWAGVDGYDNLAFIFPTEFGRYAQASVSFWVKATAAATFGFAFAGTTPTTTSLAANTWTKVTRSLALRELGQMIRFRSTTSSVVFYVTEPEVTVTTAGGQRAQLVTDNGLSKLLLTGGSAAAPTVPLAELSGAQVILGQDPAYGGATTPKMTLDNSSLRFVDQGGQSVMKRIVADGFMTFSAENLQLQAQGTIFLTGAVSILGGLRLYRDTDWANIAITGGSGTCRWRRYLGMVEVEFDITMSSALAAGAAVTTLFSVPAEAAPATPAPFNVTTAGAQPINGFVSASTLGTTFRNNGTSSQTRIFGWGRWSPA